LRANSSMDYMANPLPDLVGDRPRYFMRGPDMGQSAPGGPIIPATSTGRRRDGCYGWQILNMRPNLSWNREAGKCQRA
jgi:hypothetical protein